MLRRTSFARFRPNSILIARSFLNKPRNSTHAASGSST